MRFLAPTTHQDRGVHLRGFPRPLRSAYAVGPALAVYSPPGPVGLFRPTALMGFRRRPAPRGSSANPSHPEGRHGDPTRPRAGRPGLCSAPAETEATSWKGHEL